MDKTKFGIEPFQPTRLLRNPHIQTFVGFKGSNGDGCLFGQHRVDIPNNDYFYLDLVSQIDGYKWDDDSSSPIVLLAHGLGGSAKSAYAPELYRQLAKAGIRSAGINCTAINNFPQTYHAGATYYLEYAVKWLRSRYSVPIGLVGYSMGAIVSIHYLAQSVDVQAAATVSIPFDLEASSQILSNDMPIYNNQLIAGLKEKVLRQADKISHIVDIDKLSAIKTIRDYDEVFIAPLHGFLSAADYYQQYQTTPALPDINTPTLIIRSIDDPFLSPDDIPHSVIENNPCLTPAITKYGGHAAFAERILSPRTWWAQRQVARFLTFHLLEGHR